ncbi:hypothetical protein NQZ79_g1216 [Umbelopsis isabellina]|nr:hypothetical protein NQZ79_g1216 [Umbelopsis isabellina]
MEQNHDSNDSTLPLRFKSPQFEYDEHSSEETLERVVRKRRFSDIFTILLILLVLILATGAILALHFAAVMLGQALQNSQGTEPIPWWNSHLAMVISVCVSSLLGGLTVYLRMKKVDVILSTMLLDQGTRGDVFVDLMDGWMTTLRAVFSFDSPIIASVYSITLILLQIMPAFSGLCVYTTEAHWQSNQNVSITNMMPLNKDDLRQLQFATAISNIEDIVFDNQTFPSNYLSPANDIIATTSYDNATLMAFQVTPRCQIDSVNYVVNEPAPGSSSFLNYVDLNTTTLTGNLVAPGMQQGQIENGVITGANLYWQQYFVKKPYSYGSYKNLTDYVDLLVALVKNTGEPSGSAIFTQVHAWKCRLDIASFEVAIDNSTEAVGAIYKSPPRLVKATAGLSGAVYNAPGEGSPLIHNLTTNQFIGLAPYLSGGLSTTRALDYQKYLSNTPFNVSSPIMSNMTGEALPIHLGDIALSLQLMSIARSPVNGTALRNGSTAYTAINVQGAACLLCAAWVLAFILVIGIWNSQRLVYPTAGSTAALLSLAATRSVSEAVHPNRLGDWKSMRLSMGQHRWRLGRIYQYGEKNEQYGLSNAPFSDWKHPQSPE